MLKPTEEQMTVDERRKYLKRRKQAYQEASRGGRGRLLTEMEQVTGLHRKSLLRLLHAGSLNRKKRITPRKRTYGLAVEQVILLVWESLDYVCAERLTPVLVETAQHLARFGSVRLTAEVEQQERLQALYEQTNPLRLRQRIYEGLAALWDVRTATTEDVA